MAHMAPVKVELGQRRTPEERNKVPATLSLQTQCSQKSDDVENAAIAPVHSEPRFSPGDLHQTVDRAGKCRHTQRRLQGGERRPQAPSPPAPTEDGQDFRPCSRTPPILLAGLRQLTLSFTPPLPQHLAKKPTYRGTPTPRITEKTLTSTPPRTRMQPPPSDHLEHVPGRLNAPPSHSRLTATPAPQPWSPDRALEAQIGPRYSRASIDLPHSSEQPGGRRSIPSPEVAGRRARSSLLAALHGRRLQGWAAPPPPGPVPSTTTLPPRCISAELRSSTPPHHAPASSADLAPIDLLRRPGDVSLRAREPVGARRPCPPPSTAGRGRHHRRLWRQRPGGGDLGGAFPVRVRGSPEPLARERPGREFY